MTGIEYRLRPQDLISKQLCSYVTGPLIQDNYIMVTIPFGKTVTDKLAVKNVGINVGIKQTKQAILEILIKEPKATQISISEKIGKTPKTVERKLKKLMEKGYIIRQGSRKTEQWKVIK